MCIRDSDEVDEGRARLAPDTFDGGDDVRPSVDAVRREAIAVSYTHLRAHETVLDLVCRLLLDKNKDYLIVKSLTD